MLQSKTDNPLGIGTFILKRMSVADADGRGVLRRTGLLAARLCEAVSRRGVFHAGPCPGGSTPLSLVPGLLRSEAWAAARVDWAQHPPVFLGGVMNAGSAPDFIPQSNYGGGQS